MNNIQKLFRIVLLLLLVPTTQASEFDHAVWDGLLQTHVAPIREGVSTQVDYAGFAEDHVALKGYLAGLAEVEKTTFANWPKAERLAFLINAYNAWTVEYILTEWPDIKSIKDLGSFFRSPWKKAFIPLFGGEVSLDEIEHGMIREEGIFNEPRIHFAVNCASIGCPALRNEAFVVDRLEAQLEEQTQLFLQDTTRNRIKGKTLHLSSIFKWYGEDFEKGWGGFERLEDFLVPYADALGLDDRQKALLRSGKLKVKYLSYDWGLNSAASRHFKESE